LGHSRRHPPPPRARPHCPLKGNLWPWETQLSAVDACSILELATRPPGTPAFRTAERPLRTQAWGPPRTTWKPGKSSQVSGR
jgi:hypothetical protein